jgi:uncharacterized linocin/CFP29 family protein
MDTSTTASSSGGANTAPVAPTGTMGRDKVPWSADVWNRIDKAVHDEVMRTRVGQKFLPLRPVHERTTSVPFDSIIIPGAGAPGPLTVDEGATTRLNEYWVEVTLTPQQVQHETADLMELGHSTAVTLATRAANLLSQAEDLVIFQGQNPINDPNSLFGRGLVVNRGTPADTGLLDLPVGGAGPAPLQPPVQAVPVPLADPAVLDVYAERTFAAVSQAYALLQRGGHYGPYALVLQTIPYADTYAPLANTLILTADRITPLMTAGYYGTGTLPSQQRAAGPAYFGVLVSLGGNTMDFVVGREATTVVQQEDPAGNFRFRVVERFAFRLKDTTGVIRLEFQ